MVNAPRIHRKKKKAEAFIFLILYELLNRSLPPCLSTLIIFPFLHVLVASPISSFSSVVNYLLVTYKEVWSLATSISFGVKFVPTETNLPWLQGEIENRSVFNFVHQTNTVDL